MKKSTFQITFCLLAIALSACARNNPSQPMATATTDHAPQAVTPIPNLPEPSATPTPLRSPSRPEIPFTLYQLSAELDYNLHHLAAQETIQYFNHTGEPLPELLLLVEPNRYSGGFQLNAITWEDGQPISNYSFNGVELHIPLSEPLPPAGSLGLALQYELNLPNQQAPYGYTERQTNLGDWYPYLPPYLPGEGWVVRQDAFVGEHLAYEMADFEVNIKLSKPTAASGQALIIAASSQPQRDGDEYRYRLQAARNFAWTVSPLYQVQETKVGDVILTAYSFPYHPNADGPAMQTAAQALEVFGQIFDPYPHDSLTVVEADFLDGMEYDGMFFLSHAFYDFYTGDQKSNLTIIAAHETSHQWWYGLVGNDQALEPWLDEALSTYSELLFYENVYPDLVGWWWENRVTFHNPQGWVDSEIYEAAGFYPYRDAVYLRGASFLRDLRTLLGDEAFFAFLHDYLARFTYRQVSGDDFFAVLSEHTDADLKPLLDTYFEHR